MTGCNVWSCDTGHDYQDLVVNNGTKAYAVNSAAQRNRSAVQLNMASLAFAALPDRKTLTGEQVDQVLVDRQE